MFANCQAKGTNLAAPDVCLTPALPAPPVPIPYVNTSTQSQSVGNPTHIILGGGPAVNLGSAVPISSGDEPGTEDGVASGVNMGGTRFLAGANTVLMGGKPVARMTSTTIQNGTNAPGLTIAPSQTTVLVLAP
ncbi:MAG: DUF4150 domain-containing protein [Polyangiaceae bacterium]|jgi:hypothetical protein|nr:DUF4150 domain-containing protein [Polyangiaceae bacterium]